MTAIDLPRASYTARDFASILAELQDYLTRTRPDLQNDFNESSLGTALLEVAALVGDASSYGQDSVAYETYLATCRRYISALRWCRSIGYVPRTAIAASVTLTSVSLPASIHTNGGTVPAGAAVTGANNTRYEVLAAVPISSGATTANVTAVEGTSFTETFDPTNLPLFVVNGTNGIVANDSWSVQVGTDTWTEVANVALETSATETYSVSFDGQGRIAIQFGDGVAGKIPDDTVSLSYRTTLGSAGNAPTGAITGTMNLSVTGGGSAQVSFASSTAATGGFDPESLDEIRVNAPAYLRRQQTLHSIQDYDTAPLNVAGVDLSYADFALQSYSANIVRVAIWTSEDVTFKSERHYSPATSIAPYARYKTADSTLADTAQAYLRDRTSVGILPVVLMPGVAWVDLYAPQVVCDPRQDPTTVAANITAAVVGVFQGAGFSVRLADLYNVVRAVPGVRYFSFDRAVFEHQGKAAASGTVVFTSGIQPADGDKVTINDGSNMLVFEFDANGTLSGGTIAVPIGNSAHETMASFVAAIMIASHSLIAQKTGSSTPTAAVTQKIGGAAYNLAITKVGTNITVTGMTGGSDTLSTIREDRRVDPSNDLWPPSAYVPGKPFTGSTPWQEGGIKPYLSMSDFVINLDRDARAYYAAAYTYNNEISFSSGPALSVSAQAINLRRLVFDIIAGVA